MSGTKRFRSSEDRNRFDDVNGRKFELFTLPRSPLPAPLGAVFERRRRRSDEGASVLVNDRKDTCICIKVRRATSFGHAGSERGLVATSRVSSGAHVRRCDPDASPLARRPRARSCRVITRGWRRTSFGIVGAETSKHLVADTVAVADAVERIARRDVAPDARAAVRLLLEQLAAVGLVTRGERDDFVGVPILGLG